MYALREWPRAHCVQSSRELTVNTDRLDTPSGAASGIFHVEPEAASASSGTTRRIGWHERKWLKRRRGVHNIYALRAWPRAHCVLSSGELTVSIVRLDTLSGADNGIFYVEPEAASASGGATRRIRWHGRKSLKRRRGGLKICALRPWPRAHCVLSTGNSR